MDGSILGHQFLRTTESAPLPARRSDSVTARLVIDDDETFREAEALMLERLGGVSLAALSADFHRRMVAGGHSHDHAHEHHHPEHSK